MRRFTHGLLTVIIVFLLDVIATRLLPMQELQVRTAAILGSTSISVALTIMAPSVVIGLLIYEGLNIARRQATPEKQAQDAAEQEP